MLRSVAVNDDGNDIVLMECWVLGFSNTNPPPRLFQINARRTVAVDFSKSTSHHFSPRYSSGRILKLHKPALIAAEIAAFSERFYA